MGIKEVKPVSWLLVALCGLNIILAVIMYRQGEKASRDALKRQIIEAKVTKLEQEKEAIEIELVNSQLRYNDLEKEKQKIKIRYVKIETTINSIPDSVLDDRFRANGFHPVTIK